jgi:hypothetical protein
MGLSIWNLLPEVRMRLNDAENESNPGTLLWIFACELAVTPSKPQPGRFGS